MAGWHFEWCHLGEGEEYLIVESGVGSRNHFEGRCLVLMLVMSQWLRVRRLEEEGGRPDMRM